MIVCLGIKITNLIACLARSARILANNIERFKVDIKH